MIISIIFILKQWIALEVRTDWLLKVQISLVNMYNKTVDSSESARWLDTQNFGYRLQFTSEQRVRDLRPYISWSFQEQSSWNRFFFLSLYRLSVLLDAKTTINHTATG